MDNELIEIIDNKENEKRKNKLLNSLIEQKNKIIKNLQEEKKKCE